MIITNVQFTNWKVFEDTGRLALGPVNVIVGKNNSGKSALIQALHAIQQNALVRATDVRLGARACELKYDFAEMGNPRRRYFTQVVANTTGDLTVRFGNNDGGLNIQQTILQYTPEREGRPDPGQVGQANVDRVPGQEPGNFVYTYLSKRKVGRYDRQVNQTVQNALTGTLEHLAAKVVRLSNRTHPGYGEFIRLCDELLGFPVGTVTDANGMLVGITVGHHGDITIEAMGEGVASILGLIVDLCVADGHLFLIEEPENDIHPEALKTLLRVIIDKSARNQFVVSTHSNIVTKYLGSVPGSRVYCVDLDFRTHEVPTSTIREIGTSPEERIGVLRQLGYELYDFDLWDGWLILEESTAETIVWRYLIPWFAPRLLRVRTLAAGGTSKVEPTFEDFRRLFLFAHLEHHYRERAWVLVDGDASGRRVVERLRQAYKTWPAEHFVALAAEDFESYYPKRFSADAEKIRQLKHDARPPAKKALVEKVKEWCDSSPEQAKKALEESAAEVITILQVIERKVRSH